jgi:hypothetical protein
MKIVILFRGQNFNIYGIVLNDGSCPVDDFLEQLRQNDLASHKSIIGILKRHAEAGPIWNPEKSRPVEGYNDLYEFKSTQGARLPYFYMPDKVTIITHGFKKGRPPKLEFDKAADMKMQYLTEITNG